MRPKGYKSDEILDCRLAGYVINPSIGSYIDETQAAKDIREAILPGIMKKQSKSLSAQVVTRREPLSRRDRKSRQLNDIHQVVFF